MAGGCSGAFCDLPQYLFEMRTHPWVCSFHEFCSMGDGADVQAVATTQNNNGRLVCNPET